MVRFFTDYLSKFATSLVFKISLVFFLGVGFVPVQKTVKVMVTDNITGKLFIARWHSDLNMKYDSVNNDWVMTTGGKAGELKLRAKDSWSLNYGDHGSYGSLVCEGANSAIAAERKYGKRLNLNTPFYTYKTTKK